MKTLFLLIFFGKTILLNQTPITIGEEWIEIKPDTEISAITGGAAIYIDITQHINEISSFEEVDKKYPNNTVQGALLTAPGNEIQITNVSPSHSNKDVHLIVTTPHGPMPTDLKFTKVKLKSKVEIKNAKIYWKNGKL